MRTPGRVGERLAGVGVALLGALLLVLLAAADEAVADPAVRSAEPTPTRAGRRTVPEPARADTTFRHRDHASLSCTSCHTMDGSHGALTFRIPAGCASCHHGTATDAGCGACHAPAERAGTRRVRQRATVAEGAQRTRILPFDHARHADVACRDCHTALETPGAGTASCDACHAEHHALDATCVACHAPPPDAAHPVEAAHAGCAGSGCHGAGAPAGRAWSRPLCLACHRDMADHRPGAACDACHAVPPRVTSGTTAGPAGDRRGSEP